MPQQPKYRHRAAWWTRERVIEGLRRFYRDHGIAPTATEKYNELTKGTGRNRNGVGNPYPSFYGVLKHFGTFREAWTAAGVQVNRDFEEWTPEEEWFLREGAGILSRKELAAALNRTPNAVHRRLYDLGIHSYRARGWTFHRIERVAQVPAHIIRCYADRGELPYLRGSKCIYCDPADLLVIREINWDDPPAELAEAVRRSLMERLAKILAGQDWRAGRPYQPHPDPINKQQWLRRDRSEPAEPKPIEVSAGDWIRLRRKSVKPEAGDRAGLVSLVYWSRNRQRNNRTRQNDGGEWMARVEFKRQGDLPRLKATLPLKSLKKAEVAK